MANILSLQGIRKWRKAFLSKNLQHVEEEAVHGKLRDWAFKALA
jgi:hypothetical protein